MKGRESLMFWSNLKIRDKLIVGFGVIVIILLSISIQSYRSLSGYSQAEQRNLDLYRVIDEFRFLQESMVNMETAKRGFLITGEDSFLASYRSGKNNYDLHYNKLKDLTKNDPKEKSRLEQIGSSYESWLAITEELMEARRSAQSAVKNGGIVDKKAEAEGKDRMDQVRALIQEGIRNESKILEEQTNISKGKLSTIYKVLVFETVFGFLIAEILSYFIIRKINRSLKKILESFGKAQKGDLTVTIDMTSHDEMGAIAAGFNEMIQGQKAALADALALSKKVNDASTEINQNNQDLSQRTQEQASTLEEIASTVVEMTSSIQQTATNSQEAQKISSLTLAAVQEGEGAVEETTAAFNANKFV
ncbi:MAG TPA: CHASE3 domain-containing protein [Bacillota bacterium]|nr:CHASE3 domain-containing protein [Bacillota bacterium]